MVASNPAHATGSVVEHEPATQLEVVGLVREGIPVDKAEEMAGLEGLTLKAIADFGVLASRTLAHSRRAGRLSPTQSDRLSRFLRVFRHARTTLGDAERARTWMTRPTRALGGNRPIDLFDTDEGVRLVEDLLNRIDHGLAA